MQNSPLTYATLTTMSTPSLVSNTQKLFATAGLASDGTLYYASTPQETDGAELYAALLELENAKKSAGLTAAYQPVYYPYLGGTALARSYNLMDTPLYRGGFVNDPLHNGLGVNFNGNGQFMRTGFQVNQLSGTVGHGLQVYTQAYLDNTNVLLGTSWLAEDGTHIYDIIKVDGTINGVLLGTGDAAGPQYGPTASQQCGACPQ